VAAAEQREEQEEEAGGSGEIVGREGDKKREEI
jgi:hypothetical protein